MNKEYYIQIEAIRERRLVRGILIKVRKLLKDKGSWARGNLSFNKFGRSVNPNAKSANSWCILGGLEKVCGCYGRVVDNNEYTNLIYQLLSFAPREMVNAKNANLAEINDHKKMTHKRLMNWIDRAIGNLK